MVGEIGRDGDGGQSDGDHGAGATSLLHEGAAHGSEPDGLGGVHGAGDGCGGQLSDAVSHHGEGGDAGVDHGLGEGDLEGHQQRLGDVGATHGGVGSVGTVACGEQVFVGLGLLDQTGESLAEGGPAFQQPASLLDRLRALSREEQDCAAGSGQQLRIALQPIVDASRAEVRERSARVVGGAQHAHGASRVGGSSPAQLAAQRLRRYGAFRQGTRPGLEVLPRGRRQRQRARGQRDRSRGDGLCTLEHDVSVGSAEAEGADARAQRVGGVEAGAPVRDPQRGAREREPGIGRLRVERGGQLATLQRDNHLGEPGDPRGGEEVSQIRLHRPDRNRGSGSQREHLRLHAELDRIADERPRTVRLEGGNRLRLYSRVAIGRFDRRTLSARIGRHRADRPAVAANRRPEDRCPHRIRRRARVRPAAQDEDRPAFAGHDPVRAVREGHATPRGRQHPCGLQEVPHIGIEREVHPAGEGRVALSLFEGFAREVDRDQGRRAGGIDRHRRAGQVEGVGHAGGNHVEQIAHESCGSQLCILRARGQVAFDGVARGLWKRAPGGQRLQRSRESFDTGGGGECGAIRCRTDSEEGANRQPTTSLLSEPGVLEGLRSELQREALLRVHEPRLILRNPEEGSVERVGILEKRAAWRAEPLQARGSHAVPRRLDDPTFPREQAVVQLLRIPGSREPAGDCRDREPVGRLAQHRSRAHRGGSLQRSGSNPRCRLLHRAARRQHLLAELSAHHRLGQGQHLQCRHRRAPELEEWIVDPDGFRRHAQDAAPQVTNPRL